jgi:virulence-associated protein VagC
MSTAPTTAEVIDIDGCQAVKLPAEFRLHGSSVLIRRAGNSIILEPTRPSRPFTPAFFEAIAVDDPAFERPDQGQLPPAPSFD